MTDYVRRTGKIFEIGEYPDKQFTLNEAEARAAIAAFQPVPVDLEHQSTVLDNRLGTLEAVEMGDDGTSIIGSVSLPKWLDDLLDEGQRKVSVTWERGTKTLRGLAIVNSPRVADAVLMAAFAATPEGQALVSTETTFANPKGIQTLHDMSIAHGASCTANMAMTHDDVMQKFHDVAKASGAACLPPADAANPATMNAHSLLDTIKALVGIDPKTPPVAVTVPARAEETVDMVDTAQFAAMEARVKAAEEKAEKLESERRRERAVTFADRLVAEHRVFPAAREAIVRGHIVAAEDDASAPKTVTFARGETDITGNRVEAFEAIFATMATHGLTAELVKDVDLVELANTLKTRRDGAPVEISDASRKRLLGMSAVGQRVLKEQAAK